jgi:hypothetical protein
MRYQRKIQIYPTSQEFIWIKWVPFSFLKYCISRRSFKFEKILVYKYFRMEGVLITTS